MEEKPKRVVAYVLNLFDHTFEMPWEIIPGFILRGVTAQERLAISRLMRFSGTAPHNFAHHYESKLDFSSGISRVPESEQKSWRYYVIEYPLAEDDFFDSTWPPARKLTSFRYAAIASDANLIWGYTTFADPEQPYLNPLSWFPNIIQSYSDHLELKLMREMALHVLRESDVREIAALNGRLNGLSEDQRIVADACALYHSTYGLTAGSSFRILALFAVIELLLTHVPDPKDPTDSLTRQISAKLSLLNNRFKPRVDVQRIFPDAGKNVWKKLYSYRSAIAHGGTVDFQKEQKPLRSQIDVFFFLDDFVRRLLRHAIIEPQLCLDLKQCRKGGHYHFLKLRIRQPTLALDVGS